MTPRRLALLVAGILGAAPAAAYVHNTVSTSSGQPVAWDLSDAGTDQEEVSGGRVTYSVNASGSDDITDGSEFLAVAAAFQSWEDVAGSTVAFTRGPDTANESTANDGVFPVFWVESSTIVTQGTPDPSDDVDIGGALAVTFTWWYTSGPEAGEVVDANMVINGASHQWTTDPASQTSRYDLQSVAAHEAGHAIGLGHSPVGGATMFPRTPPGQSLPRLLEWDDAAAASALYPEASWVAGTGGLDGVVRDGGGQPVFGVHVVAQDTAGNVLLSALTQPDGSYALRGLPEATVEVWAEPLDRNDGTVVLFSEASLPPFYRGGVIDVDLETTPAQAANVVAGMTSVRDLVVTAGTPMHEITRVAGDNLSFSNRPVSLLQGDKDVRVGVAGPVGRVPSSGTPLSVTGTGILVKSTAFTTLAGGTLQAVYVTIDIDPDAPTGLRSLVIDGLGRRTLASGHLEILPAPPIVQDADGDTILDAVEGTADPDMDGLPNAGDLDSDADTIPDALEAGDGDLATDPVDHDGDETADFLDLDSDADALLDRDEGTGDGDGDALGAWVDPDRDGGGEPDGNEAIWGRVPDAAGDDVTQAPGEVPGSGAALALRVARTGNMVLVQFSPAPRADWHRVHRGTVPSLLGGSPPAPPLDCGVMGFEATDVAGDGATVFYLASGVNWVGAGPSGSAVGLGACP